MPRIALSLPVVLKVFGDIVLANKEYVDMIVAKLQHKTYYMGLVEIITKLIFMMEKSGSRPRRERFAKFDSDYLEHIAEHVEP